MSPSRYRSRPFRLAISLVVSSTVGSMSCGHSAFDSSLGGSSNDGNGDGDGVTSGGDGSAEQTCVDKINTYRSSLGLSPYERWTDEESCADGQADSDGKSNTPHGAFGQCHEFAQNECPGWPGPPENMIGSCLDMMWAEGPGDDFSSHGHYINMSSDKYTQVACGFHTSADGKVWAVQDFK